MESHSENQQLVSAENQRSNNATPSGGQQEIQSEPGYRFWPTDEEIIVHYLRKKIADPDFKSRAIPDKDIYSFDPHDGEKMSQENLFFFMKKTITKNHRDQKFSRVRFAKGGCWNYSGTEAGIYSYSEGSNLLIGVKETYKFCIDPGKIRTKWTMIEYGLPENDPQDWVVCRVFKKGDLKVDPLEKWPAASGSSSTAPTENLQHYDRSKQTATSFSAGPVVSNYDSSQLNFINTALGSSSMHMFGRPAMLQHDVASMGTVYRSQEHSGEQRGYNLNQPQINMATQQQQGPVNTHSDDQWVFNHNQHPVNRPTTLQGAHGPAHPASTMVSTTTPYSYSMVNQQLPGPNLQSDVGSIIGTRTLGWTFNPNFTQPFYNHNQQPFMPILQGQYQPAYPANNMVSTNNYNMENQQLPGITTSPILRQDAGTIPNMRHVGGNYNQSSVPPQEGDSESFLQESQPSKYRKT